MKKKIVVLVLIILLIAGLCVFFYKANKKDTSNELTLFGNIEIRQVDLSFQVSGLVSKLLKEEGDTVKKGELIAVMDESDYDANFKRAEAEVDRTLATQKDATDKYNRYAPLGVDDTVPPLIYIFIKSKPKNLISNYNFCTLFLNPLLSKKEFMGVLVYVNSESTRNSFSGFDENGLIQKYSFS